MKDKIGIVAHVDHGKATLSAAIAIATSIQHEKAKIATSETKTIHEALEHDRAIKIIAPPIIELTEWNFKDGKQSRRERRAEKRKTK